VETACQFVLSALNPGADELQRPPETAAEPGSIGAAKGNGSTALQTPLATAADDQTSRAEELVTPLRKSTRRRSKAHLAFVAAQPCLICRRSPCDAHHLKFAQPRSLGRKVSDEFTVPLCRDHHHQLHRHGNERAWWANLQIDALKEARELWAATMLRAATECNDRQSGPGSTLEPANERNTLGGTSP
jgi:hypothetical protein